MTMSTARLRSPFMRLVLAHAAPSDLRTSPLVSIRLRLATRHMAPRVLRLVLRLEIPCTARISSECQHLCHRLTQTMLPLHLQEVLGATLTRLSARPQRATLPISARPMDELLPKHRAHLLEALAPHLHPEVTVPRQAHLGALVPNQAHLADMVVHHHHLGDSAHNLVPVQPTPPVNSHP